MLYSQEEINQLERLAQNPSTENLSLAASFLLPADSSPRLVTLAYFVYNRLLWLDELALAERLFCSFTTQTEKRLKWLPILEGQQGLQVTDHFYKRAASWSIDFTYLAQLLWPFAQEKICHKSMDAFLFKYGDEAIQTAILPSFNHRDHSGRYTLNLSNLGLTVLPPLITKLALVQQLSLWGNQLKALPDFMPSFKMLEQINLTANQFEYFPQILSTLPRLRKLYGQDNPWDYKDLAQTIGKMQHLEVLALTNERVEKKADPAFRAVRRAELLVQYGKFHAPEAEQNLALAVWSNDQTALAALKKSALLNALNSMDAALEQNARRLLLNYQAHRFDPVQFRSNSLISVLGQLSGVTRLRLEKAKPFKRSLEINYSLSQKTTHIVLGKAPKVPLEVDAIDCIFMTEKDLLSLL